jgi:predicted small integral membrane protein
MKYLSNIDLVKNQLLNASVHNSATPPTNPVEGQIYFNTTSGDKQFYYFNGTNWINPSAIDLSSLVAKSLYDAYTILMATADNNPVPLTVGEQTVVGRVTGGAIAAIAIISDLTAAIANNDSIPSAKEVKRYIETKQNLLTFGIAQTNAVLVSAADVAAGEYARFTNTGLESRTAAEVLADIGALAVSAIDTDNTLAANSDTKVASQKAIKAYTDALIATANAVVYKGIIDCSNNPNFPAADAGWLYIVSVAGKIGGEAGQSVEAGDIIICNTDATPSGSDATQGTKWNVIQKNITGAVTGPASSIDGNIAVFDQTTGKLIKDGGVTIASLQNQNANHTGDVIGATTLTIALNAVTLAKMAKLPANTIIGNNTAGTADPKALTAAEVRTMLNVADGATSNIGTVVKVAASVGNDEAKDFAVVHNLNTRDVVVGIFETASPWAAVQVDYELTDVNTVTLHFASAPTSNQYRVVITA